MVAYIEMLFHALPSEVLAVWEPCGREKPSRNEQDVIPDTILERIGGKAVPGGGTHNSYEGTILIMIITTILGHRSQKVGQKDQVDSGMEGTEEA